MPQTGLLVLSVLCLAIGALLLVSPKTVVSLGRVLNRTITTVDESMLHARYIWAALLVLTSYGLFRLAVLLPTLKS